MKRLHRRASFVVFLFLAMFALSAGDAAAQCAMCRDAVASSSPRTILAMNVAIVALAFAPYAVFLLAAWRLSPSFRAFVKGRFTRVSSALRNVAP